MIRKSRFLTFILSFVPGLGQIYLGHYMRGLVFLFAEVAIGFMAALFGGTFTGRSEYVGILVPIIWFVAMVDALVLADKINRLVAIRIAHGEDSIYAQQGKEEMEKQNKKVIAMVLSIIPGVGHMYLGLQRQGLQLMVLFFLSFFLIDWLRIGLFIIFVPLIWFFGMFDAMHKATGGEIPEDGDIMLISSIKGGKPFIKNTGKFIAYGLIIIGCYLLFERIAMPQIDRFLNAQIKNYIQTAIVSMLFIAGGIKLLAGSKKAYMNGEGEINE